MSLERVSSRHWDNSLPHFSREVDSVNGGPPEGTLIPNFPGIQPDNHFLKWLTDLQLGILSCQGLAKSAPWSLQVETGQEQNAGHSCLLHPVLVPKGILGVLTTCHRS